MSNEWISKSAPKRETESAGLSKEDYLKNVAEVTRHDIQLAIDDGLYRTAAALSKRLIAAQPEVASNLTALADAYTALGPRAPEPLAEEKTGQGKREVRKRRSKLTLQEEERTLAATPSGKEMQKANYAEAEKLYHRATELEPNYALAWRGLGELFEKMKGSEPLEKEAAAATPIIEKAMAKALAAKNLTVLDSPFTTEALQNDEKLKYAVANLQRNYNELNGKIVKKQKDIEKGRFSLGDQVLLLNQDDNIDAFVFVNAAGQRKSGGKKALGIVTLNPLIMMPFYFVNIGIVDARSGDVLAYTLTATTFDIGKEDDKKLVELLTKSLKKLPSETPADKK